MKMASLPSTSAESARRNQRYNLREAVELVQTAGSDLDDDGDDDDSMFSSSEEGENVSGSDFSDAHGEGGGRAVVILLRENGHFYNVL